jgi:hypothetical protein
VVFNRSLNPEDVAAVVRAYSGVIEDVDIDEKEVSLLRNLGTSGQAVEQVRVILGAMQAHREVDSLLEANVEPGGPFGP